MDTSSTVTVCHDDAIVYKTDVTICQREDAHMSERMITTIPTLTFTLEELWQKTFRN
jgi:hypothetical protein